MTRSKLRQNAVRVGLLAIATTGITSNAVAQGVSLNYDSLSSLEEPLATEVGDVTLSLTGLVDLPLTVDHDDDADDSTDVDLVGNFQVSAETQLPNRWTVGVAYFGQYETEEPLESLSFQEPEDDDYNDRAAVFVSGAWGTVTGGNVSGLVREDTRRQRGAGNGVLAFDGFYGGMSDSGGGYIGRFGPTKISTVIDEEGNFEVGGTFQRPIGNKDYRFSVTYANGETLAADGTTEIESEGAAAIGEIVFGSSLFDASVGVEQLSTPMADADRWYASVGAQRKMGGLTLSAEGHYGEVESEPESSVAIGAAFDIARGLSVNFGFNYEDADVRIGNTVLANVEETKSVISLRYSF